MKEHRYTFPTHVREFTRYRGHFNPAPEHAPSAPPDDDAGPEPAAFTENPRAPAESDPMAAR
jgi:hypothetical protein